MAVRIPYKSFCWGLGTTSFRTKNFNKTIEKQRALLHEFWGLKENKSEEWRRNNALQKKYYDFMKDNDFVVGDANNKPKDAREKTSGLVDIGLIDDGRKITEAGNALLQISHSNNFISDNPLQIPKDSFIYLKQLLKTSNDVNGKNVRPLVVLMYLLHKLEYLTVEEFTYLLPLCADEENTFYIVGQIKNLRALGVSVDEIIINRLMSMDNYKMALDLFLKNKVTEDLICTVGMNR